MNKIKVMPKSCEDCAHEGFQIDQEDKMRKEYRLEYYCKLSAEKLDVMLIAKERGKCCPLELMGVPWKCALIKDLQRYEQQNLDNLKDSDLDNTLDEWQKGFYQGIAEGLDRAIERIRKIKAGDL
jgi:hypothetical protein